MYGSSIIFVIVPALDTQVAFAYSRFSRANIRSTYTQFLQTPEIRQHLFWLIRSFIKDVLSLVCHTKI